MLGDPGAGVHAQALESASEGGQPANFGTGFDRAAQQTPARFGGAYAELDPRRQRLVDDWVARFNDVTKQNAESGPLLR
jgi:hypothetical protein